MSRNGEPDDIHSFGPMMMSPERRAVIDAVLDRPAVTPETFDALTKPQIVALCNVAFGGHGAGLHRRTIEKLLAADLIVPVAVAGRDSLGTFTYTTYEMQIPVHIAFCEWCDRQNYDDNGDLIP